VSEEYNKEEIRAIYRYPHILGKIAGKTKLTRLHSEWIRYCWHPSDNRSLQAHRGSYKTTAIVAVGTLWWLLFNPNDRISIIRKTYSDSAEVVQMISLMTELPEVKRLFYDVQGIVPKKIIDRDGEILWNFKGHITPEPSIQAHGLDYGMTGKHYDRIVCDDFVGQKDRYSRAEREKTGQVLEELLTNIIDPGKPVITIGTPWHKMDAWSKVPPGRKFSVSQTGILTEEEIVRKRKTTTPSLYAANYLLEHVDDGDSLFPEPIFAPWDSASVTDVVAHVDAAYDGDHYCAHTIIGKRKDGKYCGIGFTFAGNIKDWIEKIHERNRIFGVRCTYTEKNADKGYSGDEIRKAGELVYVYSENMNKHAKISTHLYKYWQQIEWDDRTDGEYMGQCNDYREGQEPDDAPDSAASLFREWQGKKASVGTLFGRN